MIKLGSLPAPGQAFFVDIMKHCELSMKDTFLFKYQNTFQRQI